MKLLACQAAVLFAASFLGALLPAATLAQSVATPTLWWVDHPPGAYAFAPFKSLSFSWSVEWDATNSTAHVVGQFNYTAGHGYVAVGTNSPGGMDGLNIICFIPGGAVAALCDDWHGSWYDIDPASTTRTTVVSSTVGSNGINSITFRRIAFENSRDLGDFTWGAAKRVIWAYGPMEDGREAGTHPGEGIWSNLVDFKTGEHPVAANPNTHLHAVYAAVALTAAVIVIIQMTVLLKIKVHHFVREAFGWLVTLVYIAFFVWYIVASKNDYTSMAALGPEARAMGDGAAAALGVLLLSGTRRFIPETLFTVSHERMIVYHTVAGLAFVACLAGHAIAMTQFYFLPYMFRWTSQDPYSQLPGIFAAVLTLFVFLPALVRFHISYRFFRIMHWLWAPVVVFTILHVPRLLWFCLPGLVCLCLNFVYGKLANCGSRVEHVAFDPATQTVTLDMSRPYYSLCATGEAEDMGIAPAQWFYIVNLKMSLAWHPFSVARCNVVTAADGSRRQHLRFVIKETKGLAGGGGFVTDLINKALRSADLLDKANELRGRGSWTTKLAQAAAGPNPAVALSGTFLEGPFGRLQMPVLAYENLIFVSGGIGVTPNLLTLQYVASVAAARAARGAAVPWRNVLWTWVNRDAAMLALFAGDLAKYALQLEAAGVTVVMRNFVTGKAAPPPPTELADKSVAQTAGLNDSATDSSLAVQYGTRPDYAAEFKSFAAATGPATAAMYSCGPLPMINAAGDGAQDCGRDAQLSIHHHHEVFDV